MWKLIAPLTKWSSINRFGKNRLLASSYIWLIVVPVFAKAVALVESPLNFSEYVPGLIIDLELPFSWELFFISAFLISIANGIYYFLCPKVIKDYENYATYSAELRPWEYLQSLGNNEKGFVPQSDHAKNFFRNQQTNDPQAKTRAPFAFHELYDFQDEYLPWVRVICLLLFLAGLALILWVIGGNCLFVFTHM